MPGFCFISGYLSNHQMTWKRTMNIVQLLFIYVIFQIIYYLFSNSLGVLLNASHIQGAPFIETFQLPINIWVPTKIDEIINMAYQSIIKSRFIYTWVNSQKLIRLIAIKFTTHFYFIHFHTLVISGKLSFYFETNY